MRFSTYALLCLSLLVSACGKDSVSNEFAITGLSNVNMGTPQGSQLNLSVTQISGANEKVDITVTGLPSGVKSTSFASGDTPPFTTNLAFSTNYTTLSGHYPIKVVGKSSSFTKSYDLNLDISPYNSFNFEGIPYKIGNSYPFKYPNSQDSLYVLEDETSYYWVFLHFLNGHFPTNDGTYKIVSTVSLPDEVQVLVRDNETKLFLPTGNDYKTASIKVKNGNLSVFMSDVEMQMDGVPYKVYLSTHLDQ